MLYIEFIVAQASECRHRLFCLFHLKQILIDLYYCNVSPLPFWRVTREWNCKPDRRFVPRHRQMQILSFYLAACAI